MAIKNTKTRYNLFKINRLLNSGNKVVPGFELDVSEASEFNYKDLLLDERWKKKRLEIINRDNAACFICSSITNLHVHHRQYHYFKSLNRFRFPWEYEQHLLITLCKNCHLIGHKNYQVPIIYF